jgi:hypothetical protein
MRYRLRTLMILLAVGPPFLVARWLYPFVVFVSFPILLAKDAIDKLFGLEAKRVRRWRSFSSFAAQYPGPGKDRRSDKKLP